MRFWHATMWTLRDEIEYRRRVERMARQDAAEKTILKSVPSRVIEVSSGGRPALYVPNFDSEYG